MRSQLTTGQPRNQTVVIEYSETTGPEWTVLHNNGEVEVLDTATAALRSVKRKAKQGNRSMTVTTIEWRNVKPGFKPPADA